MRLNRLHRLSGPGNGFYLRDAAEWDALHQAACFVEVQVEAIETEHIGATGAPIKRYVFMLKART